MSRLRGERSRIEAEHYRGASGQETSRALSDALDEVLGVMARPYQERRDWALVALGGYGRRELSPRSDVDLMVVCRRHERTVEDLAQTIFYALWDAGIETGHGVRDLGDCRRLADGSLHAQTSFLTSRLVAGDARLYGEFREETLRRLRKQSGRPFLLALLAENRRRHAEYGEAAYRLEPHLKDGQGGLRDVHSVVWAAAVAYDVPGGHVLDYEALARTGAPGLGDPSALCQALGFLHQVRNHLHFVTGRRTDQLLLTHVEEVARFLGYAGTPAHTPEQSFLRDLHRHLDAIWQAASGFWEEIDLERLRTPSPRRSPGSAFAIDTRPPSPPQVGVRSVGPHSHPASRLDIRPPSPPQWGGAQGVRFPLSCRAEAGLLIPGNADGDQAASVSPELALSLFALAAHSGLGVSHRLSRSLRAGLAGASAVQEWSAAELADFRAVLRAGPDSAELLGAMDRAGLLDAYIPEWAEVRFLVQPGVYHIHTVDRHTQLTVSELHRLAAGECDGIAATLFGEVEDLDTLLLAALLHDLGKAGAGDHCEPGARLASAIGRRMGLPPDAVATTAFLVQHHLLLATTASRRDLDDEDLIRDLAGRIGGEDRLTMLYLLTVADSVATGPGAWTQWKATLLRELYLKIRGALRRGGHESRDRQSRLAGRRAAVETALAPAGAAHRSTVHADGVARAFLDRMPEDYLLAQPVEAIVRHVGLLTRPLDGSIRVGAWHAAESGCEELALVAPDQPGLLWRICGVFVLHGVSILEARAYTDSAGVVLDLFRLADAFEPRIGEEKRARIERDLGLAVEGRLALGYRIAEKLAHYRRASRVAPESPPRVMMDNTASGCYTVVEVAATDRLGLLYTVSRALSELSLDIHLAKATTLGHEAIDTFYVRDLRGRKVEDPSHLKEVERTILFELSQSDRVQPERVQLERGQSGLERTSA